MRVAREADYHEGPGQPGPRGFWSRFAPFGVAALLIGPSTTWLIRAGTALAGQFTYPLDDTYIHLAIARRLIENGVWGINTSVSTSASSSPLWTLLVAAAGAIGVPLDYAPLVLSLLAAIGWVAAVDALLSDAGMRPLVRGLALMVLAVAGLVSALTVMGMEHTLHAALCLWFLMAVRRWDLARWRTPLLVLAAVLPLVRFEALALVFAAAVWRWRSSWRDAAAIAAAAIAPLALFSAVSLASGWLWLPNSVLTKLAGVGTRRPGDTFGWERLAEGWERLWELQPLVFALLALLVAGSLSRRLTREAVLVAVAVAAHVAIMPESPLERYEGYLVSMVLIAVASGLHQAIVTSWRGGTRRQDIALAIAGLLVVISLYPLYLHARHVHDTLPVAMRNIAEQPRQTARFVREVLQVPGPVVVIDIGLVAYAGGREVIDFMGLGDTAIARRHLAGTMDRAALQAHAAAAGAGVAIMSEAWMQIMLRDARPPDGWRPIGRWTIADNVVCGDAMVTLFATRPEVEAALRRDFQAFAATLPARVTATPR